MLYTEFLLQLGRVVKPTTGRLVLLTYDRRSFNLVSLTPIKIILSINHYIN